MAIKTIPTVSTQQVSSVNALPRTTIKALPKDVLKIIGSLLSLQDLSRLTRSWKMGSLIDMLSTPELREVALRKAFSVDNMAKAKEIMTKMKLTSEQMEERINAYNAFKHEMFVRSLPIYRKPPTPPPFPAVKDYLEEMEAMRKKQEKMRAFSSSLLNRHKFSFLKL